MITQVLDYGPAWTAAAIAASVFVVVHFFNKWEREALAAQARRSHADQRELVLHSRSRNAPRVARTTAAPTHKESAS